MRTSKYLLSTIKENPNDIKILSYKLMIRSGMIRKISTGLYTWLPTGLKVLQKIINIIREEMNKSGAIEILMPFIQPINLWKKSGRYKKYGKELLNFTDRNLKKFIIGPTNEEIITNLIKKEIYSYKQLPINLYQIHTKFRDEIRPRYGVIRSKEFIMKDAYSFHKNQKSLEKTYKKMYKLYINIFKRIKLKFKIVLGNNEFMGGEKSHEFQAISNIGEDSIAISNKSNFISKTELTKVIIKNKKLKPTKKIKIINCNNLKKLIKHYNISIKKTTKIFIVYANKKYNNKFIALMIRGDHELNILKVEKINQIYKPITYANKKEIYNIIGTTKEFIGPINLKIPLIIDKSVSLMNDFVSGANIKNKYFIGINWNRDLKIPKIFDLRNVIKGDISPDGNGKLEIKKCIEIGHIFELGIKYSKLINATIQNKYGKKQFLYMSCYGIGITRILAAIIEQNNDKHGIKWPSILSPFHVVILPINMYNNNDVKIISNNIYYKLKLNNIDVLLDDRNESPGIMFNDIELIGITHIIIISKKNIKYNKIEYKNRITGNKKLINILDIIKYLINKINK